MSKDCGFSLEGEGRNGFTVEGAELKARQLPNSLFGGGGGSRSVCQNFEHG